MKDGFYILKELKEWEFDVYVNDYMVPDMVMGMYLEIPAMAQLFYLPSTIA